MNRTIFRWGVAAILFAAFSIAFSGCKGMGTKVGNGAKTKFVSNPGLPNEPDVTFPELQGGNLPLTSLKGKVVLVNFWATWCEPCRVEIPWMIGFQQKYASQGFTILGVAMDDDGKKAVEPFVQNTQFDVDGTKTTMSYPIIIGNEDIAEKFGGLIGLPTSVLISRDGKIVKRFIGLVNHDQLRSEIEKQLAAHS
ncbi:MAG TPA: TlpA disulfide reductase family protein [Candidatus Limnocylindrales bacterium]|nr:TlpA disulfide reductase family protein [Candidatus Limnocylindrales bacterium]